MNVTINSQKPSLSASSGTGFSLWSYEASRNVVFRSVPSLKQQFVILSSAQRNEGFQRTRWQDSIKMQSPSEFSLELSTLNFRLPL